jgi:cytoskeletal protein CcmA (bactofilin family)
VSAMLFARQTDKGANDHDKGATDQMTVAAVGHPEPERGAPPNGAAPATGHAILDHGSKAAGKLSFQGPAWIDGDIEGEISGKDTVTIGESAVVSAQIRAASVLVAGKVTGNITATERIEIRPSARVECDLVSPVLIIQEGAHFEGRCSMRGEGRRAERRVATLPEAEHRANGAVAEDRAGSAARW